MSRPSIKLINNDIPLTGKDKNTIVTWIYNTHIVEWTTAVVTHLPFGSPLNDDYIQEIYLMLAEIPQEKWDELYEQGKRCILAYVMGIVNNQLKSQVSLLYKKYKKYELIEVLKDDIFWDTYCNEN